MPFLPKNPDFERVVRERFARQTFMASLGATLEAVEPGAVRIGVPYAERLCQQNGYLHAGVLTSIADSACGYAAFTLSPAGHDVLAVEFKISLLAPARAPRFAARARVLRAGGTLVSCAADVVAVTAAGEELVATMLSTIITRGPRDPSKGASGAC